MTNMTEEIKEIGKLNIQVIRTTSYLPIKYGVWGHIVSLWI